MLALCPATTQEHSNRPSHCPTDRGHDRPEAREGEEISVPPQGDRPSLFFCTNRSRAETCPTTTVWCFWSPSKAHNIIQCVTKLLLMWALRLGQTHSTSLAAVLAQAARSGGRCLATRSSASCSKVAVSSRPYALPVLDPFIKQSRWLP